MDKLDDTYYIQQTLNGHTEFFGRLVDRYSHRVYLLILKIVRQREDAEELTQDVLLKTFRVLSTFKGDCRFSTWLYRIAYNTAISATRKKKIEFLYIEENTIDNIRDEQADTLFNTDPASEQLGQLKKAVDLLSPEEIALLTLFYQEGHPIEEIADITGMTATNIKVKLHRIRKKLYIIMEDKI